MTIFMCFDPPIHYLAKRHTEYIVIHDRLYRAVAVDPFHTGNQCFLCDKNAMCIYTSCRNYFYLFSHLVLFSDSSRQCSRHTRGDSALQKSQAAASISHALRAAAAILDQFSYAFVHCISLALGKTEYIEYGVVYQPALEGGR